eukprot:365506-Chlamydomonas_euryale.AAC.8
MECGGCPHCPVNTLNRNDSPAKQYDGTVNHPPRPNLPTRKQPIDLTAWQISKRICGLATAHLSSASGTSSPGALGHVASAAAAAAASG